ncbi:MAG TPA: alpha/beta fold hydrolase [Candidatus Tumulicola sp.]
MLAAALLVVGSLALRPCDASATYYCGEIRRPIDSTGRIAGSLDIAFTWLRHTQRNRPSSGTIVAAEGGPGDPSGASRDGYRALFAPLLATHDLLMMDDRGTGRSGAIDCPSLQRGWMTLAAIAHCGAQLGPRAGLYGSAQAADDLDSLLTRLAIARVDLYGDSYGTFFVQTFAMRHPSRVRRVVLDGAYPVQGLDPWYPSTTPTIANAFDLVCRRATVCAARGSSMPRVRALLQQLRRGRGPIAPWQLAFVMDTAGLDPLVYRELDAAARAWLERRDAVPLARLGHEAGEFEEAAPEDPRQESNGLFVAASCTDNPQAYDMRLQPAQRQTQWRSVEAAKISGDPDLYAPFAIREFLQMPLDYAYVPLCQNWPVAPPGHPAGQPVAPGARMPDVPALVLTGDLDTITTPAEGDSAAALFRRAQRVIVRNTGHVTAIGDPWNCASSIVRKFLNGAEPAIACARQVPALPLVDAFARSRSTVPAARPSSGTVTPQGLRDAANALDAAGDALARVRQFDSDTGSGLRGGRYSVRAGASTTRIALNGVRWTADYPVTGTLIWDRDSGSVVAELRAAGLRETASWNLQRDSRAAIVVRGEHPGRLTAPAP